MKPVSKQHITRSACAVLTAMLFPNIAWADLQGDEAAIALANKMITAMGGHEIWASAIWMHVKERSSAANQPNLIAHEAWRGLQVQQARYSSENQDVSYVQAWNLEGGWRIRNGEFQQFDAERHGEETSFWQREIYTMYHRFAVGDPMLRLISTDGNAFRIEHSETGESLGSFSVSAEGGVLVWSSGETDFDVSYVYGPLKAFGAIKLPAWGAQTNGFWRFNYLEATLHTTPMPDDLMLPQ